MTIGETIIEVKVMIEIGVDHKTDRREAEEQIEV